MRFVSDSYIALFSHFVPCGVWEAVYIIDGCCATIPTSSRTRPCRPPRPVATGVRARRVAGVRAAAAQAPQVHDFCPRPHRPIGRLLVTALSMVRSSTGPAAHPKAWPWPKPRDAYSAAADAAPGTHRQLLRAALLRVRGTRPSGAAALREIARQALTLRGGVRIEPHGSLRRYDVDGHGSVGGPDLVGTVAERRGA
jgi:hypothetical protein